MKETVKRTGIECHTLKVITVVLNVELVVNVYIPSFSVNVTVGVTTLPIFLVIAPTPGKQD